MCIFCGGKLEKDTMEYIEKKDNYIVVIKNIPCEKCTQCGEEYLSDETMEKLEQFLSSIEQISSELTVTVFDYEKKIA